MKNKERILFNWYIAAKYDFFIFFAVSHSNVKIKIILSPTYSV